MIYDIAVIGSGPGGYVSALKAAQLGAKVALIEKQDLGGVCLNRGCIPTKAMLASVACYENIRRAKSFGITVGNPFIDLADVIERQQSIVTRMRKGLEQLLKSYPDITVLQGTAGFVDRERLVIASEQPVEITAQNIIIATGSEAASLPGIDIDHNLVINSDDALKLTELPRKMVIIGAGAIGVEWARIYSAFGVEVTIIEALDKLLPAVDEDLSNALLKLFKKSKINVITGVKVKNIQKQPDIAIVELDNNEVLQADKVLMAVGRSPNTEIKGLLETGVELNGRFIKTNDCMQTTVPGIYAIGDVAGKLPLAHVASHEGIVAVECILNKVKDPVNYARVPFCIYGEPEIASAGFTETQAKDLEINYDVRKAFFMANGKAMAEGETTGFIKTLVEKSSKSIIGVHIIGPGASDIIHQGVIALSNELSVEEFESIVYAHPTISETFLESVINLHVPGKPLKR
jgi:dihydrolipoamide dehydrogenase